MRIRRGDGTSYVVAGYAQMTARDIVGLCKRSHETHALRVLSFGEAAAFLCASGEPLDHLARAGGAGDGARGGGAAGGRRVRPRCAPRPLGARA